MLLKGIKMPDNKRMELTAVKLRIFGRAAAILAQIVFSGGGSSSRLFAGDVRHELAIPLTR